MIGDNFTNQQKNSIYQQSDSELKTHSEILKAIDTTSEGEKVRIKEVTSFDWEKACVFGEGASHEQINKELGFDWLKANGFVEDQYQLLVFLQGRRVVQSVLFRPFIFGSLTITNPALLACYSPDAFELTVGGYDTAGQRYKLLYLP